MAGKIPLPSYPFVAQPRTTPATSRALPIPSLPYPMSYLYQSPVLPTPNVAQMTHAFPPTPPLENTYGGWMPMWTGGPAFAGLPQPGINYLTPYFNPGISGGFQQPLYTAPNNEPFYGCYSGYQHFATPPPPAYEGIPLPMPPPLTATDIFHENLAMKRSGYRKKRSSSGYGCGFCKSNKESRMVWISHRSHIDGITTCPILRNYSCPSCGATGDNAHTLKKCPLNEDPSRMVRSSRKSTGSMCVYKRRFKEVSESQSHEEVSDIWNSSIRQDQPGTSNAGEPVIPARIQDADSSLNSAAFAKDEEEPVPPGEDPEEEPSV